MSELSKAEKTLELAMIEIPASFVIDPAMETNAKLKEIASVANDIVIKDRSDRDGYILVKSCLQKTRNLRLSVEAKRKELKKPALEFNKAVELEAKRIMSDLSKSEAIFKSKMDVVDNENALITAEKKRVLEAIYEARCEKLKSEFTNFDGSTWTVGGFPIGDKEVRNCSDEAFVFIENQFASLIGELKEKKTLKEAEEANKAEQARLERAEDEKQIAIERAELKKESARLKKIEDENKRTADELRAKELKLQADQKAIDLQKEKEERDKQNELEREEKKASDAKEHEAQMSDSDRVADVLGVIQNVNLPRTIKSRSATEIFDQVESLLDQASELLEEFLNKTELEVVA